MVDQLSRQIADRYRLVLDQHWSHWFDQRPGELLLPGEFRFPVTTRDLLDAAPEFIWPGLMLPDALPLIGNEYGDWICVRVGQDNSLVETIHWYHGGGDWIPLGATPAEAILHDVIDQFRPRNGQPLRGASEQQRPDHRKDVGARVADDRFRSWIDRCLGQAGVDQVLACLESDVQRSLGEMLQRGWALEAVTCDLIEYALQWPVRSLADPEVPKRLGINTEPDFVRWQFDSDQMPRDVHERIQEILGELDGQADCHPQDWQRAERLATTVGSRRQDLAWASDIAGWAAWRTGDLQRAAKIFFDGRFASAFSDQSVRLKTHWFDQRFGKFTLSQLWATREQLASPDREDAYVQTVWQTPLRLLNREVQDYWYRLGKEQMRQGQFALAYQSFYRAGWDLGAQRMTDYVEILSALVESAEAAGWQARATVAATHLACLSKVTPRI